MLRLSVILIAALMLPVANAQNSGSSIRPPQIEQRSVSPEALAGFRSQHDYVPVSRDELERLLSQWQAQEPATGSAIERATYTARLSGSSLTDGTITLEIDPGSSRGSQGITSLGASSLQNIQLFASGQKLELATNSQGDLISLGNPASGMVSGTWTAEGKAVGQSTVFQLKLPVASLCEFTILTAPDIVISSPNALVVRGSSTDTDMTWVLYPQTPASLTVSCTSRTESLRNESTGLTIAADYRFRRLGGHVTWTVGVPQALTNSALQFGIGPGCNVRAITLSNGTSLDWTTPADSETSMQVRIPPASGGLNLSIEADIIGSQSQPLHVPFLVPDYWQPESTEPGGPLAIRAAGLKLVVAPEIIVTKVDVEGAFESDVQYTSDGSQVLNLTQFAQAARVVLHTVPSTPVIDDSIVIQEFADDGKADAFVSVLARAGFAGTLRWSVPTAWRVTDVLELSTRTPLLFHISDASENDSASQLAVTLRTPVTAGTTQNLLIRLQSTGGQLHVESPSLNSPAYHRQHDFVVPVGDRAGLQQPPSSAGMDIVALEKRLPWLPTGDLDGKIAYERSEMPAISPATTAPSGEGMVAAVDYSVSADRNSVREFLRLNLRSPGELPGRIPIRVTSGIDLRLSDQSVTRPAPVLRREASGRRSDEWVLELPSGSSNPFEIDILLTAIRPLAASLNATMLEVPVARHEGGTLQPPAADGGVVLASADSKPMTDARQYPARPLEFNAKLLLDAADTPPQTVGGNAFLMLSRLSDSVRLNAQYRLLVRSHKASPQLVFRCEAVESVLIFIDGQHVFAEQSGNTFQIPLSEQHEGSTIDLFLTSHPIPDQLNTFHVPVLVFPEAGSVQLTSFLLTPPRHVPSSLNEDSFSSVTSATPTAPVTRLLRQQTAPPDPTSVSTAFALEKQKFAALWQLRTSQSDVVCLITEQTASAALPIRLHDTRLDATVKILAGLVAGLFWIWLLPRSAAAWWLAAGSLLVTALWQHGLTSAWRPVPGGIVYGTTIAGLLCILRRFQLVSRGDIPSISYPVAVVSGIVILLCTASTFGFDEARRPQVLIPEGPLPIVYADRAWLEKIREVSVPRDQDALVVGTQIEINLRAPLSASATITCEVATRPDAASGLTLPLDDVTPLVDCYLDGQPVFPTRSSTGETRISTPPQALVPTRPLDPTVSTPYSPGPGTIGNSLLRFVRYTVRLVPQPAPGAYHMVIPHPPSPQTSIVLLDPDQLLSSAALAGSTVMHGPESTGRFQLPPLFNSRRADLSIKLRHADAIPVNRQFAEVTCKAEVWPAQTRLFCDYRITPADARSTEVRVGRNPRYRVSTIESSTGQRLPWAVQDNQLSIQIAPNAAGIQQFRIQLITETATSLQHQFSLQELATVNGVRTEQLKLQPETSELFIVSKVMANGRSLNDIAAATAAPANRNPDNGIAVPPDVDRIDFTLARRQATREARLVQQAVVKDNEIEWNCRCEIDITGQPVFRQILKISPEVRISEITARNGEVARLQSWSRNDDLVIVSLREATRGSLVLNVQGALPRQPGTETRLPVIGLPDSMEILESSLEVSAASESDIFISDLAGNIPDSPMAIQSTPIPRNPVRMSVTDERRPLIIQANPDKRVLASVAAVIYESDDRTMLAQFLSLRTPDAAFNVPLNLPNTAAFATCETWVGQASEFSRQESDRGRPLLRILPESESPIVVAVINIVPARDRELLSVPLPGVDADFRIESFQAFDLRPSTATDSLPAWLQTTIRRMPGLNTTTSATIVDASFDTARKQIQIRLPLDAQTPQTGSVRGGVVFTRAEHDLQPGNGDLLIGTSGFLTFALQDSVLASIRIPPGTWPVEVTVNGVAVPAAISDSTMTLPTADRVSCIRIVWVRDVTQGIPSTKASVPLPHLICPQTSVATSVSSRSPEHWSARQLTDDADRIDNERLQAITTGLQLIDSETLSQTASDTSLPDDFQSLTPSPVWQQLSAESSAAMLAFGRLLLPDTTTINRRYLAPAAAEDVRLASPQVPSLLTSLSVLSALMLLLTPVLARPPRQATPSSEGSTVVTEPDTNSFKLKEPSTVHGTPVPHPDSHI